jgi:Bacterial protein of unknown function (HtrL_YibB)
MKKQMKVLQITLIIIAICVFVYWFDRGYEGFETDASVTVVSAYYEFSSKHGSDKYKQWIRDFLEGCPCNLVFFTDEKSYDFIQECRSNYMDRTNITILPMEEWRSSNILTDSEWNQQESIDPEKSIHSKKLYKVWFEKKNFVLKAIEMNPFNSQYFLWTDAGLIRDNTTRERVKMYPNISKVDQTKILLLNIEPFVADDTNDCCFKGKNRIGGGIIGASAEMWKVYSEKYEAALLKNKIAGHFVGKDQSIMARIYLENKDIFQLVQPENLDITDWMYLIKYLS